MLRVTSCLITAALRIVQPSPATWCVFEVPEVSLVRPRRLLVRKQGRHIDTRPIAWHPPPAPMDAEGDRSGRRLLAGAPTFRLSSHRP